MWNNDNTYASDIRGYHNLNYISKYGLNVKKINVS